jgi:hypothetical protein
VFNDGGGGMYTGCRGVQEGAFVGRGVPVMIVITAFLVGLPD